MATEKQGWIGVDLDGTLAVHNGFQGVEHIGEPIAPMVDRVKRWLEKGLEVRIFTARVSVPDGADESRFAEADAARERIEDWSYEIFGTILRVTNVKDYEMVQLWDDRAIQVLPNTGLAILVTSE